MSDDPLASASPGYALGRLLHALDTATAHADPAVRARATERAAKWRSVLEGMASGHLRVGSRTPVADTPAWVTLEVVHGGFATGRYLAEGPLEPHEEALLADLPAEVPGATPRARLNQWFLGDAGQRALVEAIRGGRLTITIPEEGALPAIAWLLEAGAEVDALELVATLRPLFERLRFYPRLEATPRPQGALVRVATIEEVTAGLRATCEKPQVVAMNEALSVWAPLYDRLLALWLETVEGEPPRFVRGADGEPLRDPKGQPVIGGGWPCQRWPAGWDDRRAAWLDAYWETWLAASEEGRPALKNDRRGLGRLRDALGRVPEECRALDRRAIARIRQVLAGAFTRHGLPDSPERAALRREQAAIAARPSNAAIARAFAARLDAYPAKGGLGALDPIALPIRAAEHPGIPEGTAIPPSMIDKATRALEAPIAELVERGVIASAEVLAIVLPQISAEIAAAGIDDPGLRGLYSQIYAAFRRRRSLLLLNLEHQVRFDELPWIAALASLRRSDQSDATRARQTLEEVTLLALGAFPQTILPNPLVREMGALAGRAGVDLPLTEEVAADIFMGTFTSKWADAARSAAGLLAGTLYARYYDLPASDHPALHEGREAARQGKTRVRWGKATAEGFAALCTARAREAGSAGGSHTARNGAILEQSQILTTHNLAVLLAGLDLVDRTRPLAPAMARDALRFAVRRQTQVAPGFRAQLQAVKNAAYAWRQGIFFLSLCDAAAQREALAELEREVARVRDRAWAGRFEPALAGLRLILGGGRFDDAGIGPGPARRFLGWSVGKHWLFA
ncbi:MAG: hypothetical protein H6711_03725 [Myxococcales bacterium]|nr:hypothetical protein [Myxococcales bacterium]